MWLAFNISIDLKNKLVNHAHMLVCLWQTAKGIYSKLNNTRVLLLGMHIVAMVTHDHNITLYVSLIVSMQCF